MPPRSGCGWHTTAAARDPGARLKVASRRPAGPGTKRSPPSSSIGATLSHRLERAALGDGLGDGAAAQLAAGGAGERARRDEAHGVDEDALRLQRGADAEGERGVLGGVFLGLDDDVAELGLVLGERTPTAATQPGRAPSTLETISSITEGMRLWPPLMISSFLRPVMKSAPSWR